MGLEVDLFSRRAIQNPGKDTPCLPGKVNDRSKNTGGRKRPERQAHLGETKAIFFFVGKEWYKGMRRNEDSVTDAMSLKRFPRLGGVRARKHEGGGRGPDRV